MRCCHRLNKDTYNYVSIFIEYMYNVYIMYLMFTSCNWVVWAGLGKHVCIWSIPCCSQILGGVTRAGGTAPLQCWRGIPSASRGNAHPNRKHLFQTSSAKWSLKVEAKFWARTWFAHILSNLKVSYCRWEYWAFVSILAWDHIEQGL